MKKKLKFESHFVVRMNETYKKKLKLSSSSVSGGAESQNIFDLSQFIVNSHRIINSLLMNEKAKKNGKTAPSACSFELLLTPLYQ